MWLQDAGTKPPTNDSELGAALLGGAIVALVVFLTGQASQLEGARESLSLSLVARFTTPAFTERVAVTVAFLRTDTLSLSELRLPEQQRVLSTLNAFEWIGAAYVAKEANRAILYRHFSDVAVVLWEDATGLVRAIRESEANPRLFQEWEHMVVDFRQKSARRPVETYRP